MVELAGVLESLRGQEIYFEEAGGNHGDTLIQFGSKHELDQYALRRIADPHAAAAIVINGGGALGVEIWNKNLDGLNRFAQTFPKQPLVVLPSAFYFEGDHLTRCFVNRTAPAYLFARERYSFKQIETQTYPSTVQIGLANDMAFALRDTPFVGDLKKRDAARHILLVERFDREAVTAPPQPIAVAPSLKSVVPGPVKRALKKMVHRRRVASSSFTPTTLDRLYQEAPQFKGLPVLAEDVSSPVGFTFEQFLNAITEAAVVITTRLHVGILAAMLEKPTYLISGNTAYPKLRGVYEYSLANSPHVHLW